MDNQALTASASAKFTVEFAGPRSPYRTETVSPQGSAPTFLIAKKCWLGLWCPRCAQGQESKSTHSSPALHPLGTVLNWASHSGKLFTAQRTLLRTPATCLFPTGWSLDFLLYSGRTLSFENHLCSPALFSLAAVTLLYLSFCILTIHFSHLPTSWFYFCFFF